MKLRKPHHPMATRFLVTKAGRASSARPWTPRPPKTPVPARTVQGEPTTPNAATRGTESHP